MGQGNEPPARPRVVMIVDNAVDGDSRVQKVAESVAEAGYDAVLIGRSPTGRRDESMLGGARVLRLPQPNALLAHPRRNPGHTLRWPLAYPNRDVKGWRRAQIEAMRNDLGDGRAALAASGATGVRRLAGRLWLRVRRLVVDLRALWHGLRSWQYVRAIGRRTTPNGRLDDLVARVWVLLRRRAAWRRLDPQLTDFEIVYGPEIDKLRPALIHAHDFRMVGIAVRAAARAKAAGRSCAVVYDAHEFMPGVRSTSLRWRLANEGHELAYARQADAVVTVSPVLADMLRERHGLPEQPSLVLNAPAVATDAPARSQRGIRADTGVGKSTPLIVYAGSPAVQRGLHTVVAALEQMPDVHAAFVLPGRPQAVLDLEKDAVERGVADRLHILDYVGQDEVVGYLRSADIGLVPVLHQPNHEIAIGTKYLEYAQARLPIVSSDVKTQAELTREMGNGEVFVAGDVDGFVTAVRAVLADPERYRAAYDRPGLLEGWSWGAQARTLLDVYATVLGRAG